MMKCRNCKNNTLLDDGKQFSWCEIRHDNLDIDEERYCSAFTPATNADRIRAMTDDELAEELSFIGDCRCPDGGECGHENSCLWCWQNWLQQEVEHDV